MLVFLMYPGRVVSSKSIKNSSWEGSLTGYDGLNKNGHHRNIYLNVLSSWSDTTWEGLGSVGLLKVVCHSGLDFEV